MQPLPHEASRPVAADRSSIEWEALPSLAYLLGRGRNAANSEPVWADTQLSEFGHEADASPEVFEEPLPGLAIREVYEPDIFRLFFQS